MSADLTMLVFSFPDRRGSFTIKERLCVCVCPADLTVLVVSFPKGRLPAQAPRVIFPAQSPGRDVPVTAHEGTCYPTRRSTVPPMGFEVRPWFIYSGHVARKAPVQKHPLAVTSTSNRC